jgi:2-dehydro-3-deoxygluconokinase
MSLQTDAIIATYGEPLLRLSSPDHTRLAAADTLDVAVGGAELNVAIGLSSLGRPTRVIAAVPDSFVGDAVVRAARAAGASTDFISRVAESRMGVYYVEKASAPRGHRVVYDRRDSAFTRAEVPADALDGVGLLVVSGITAELGDASLARLERLVGEAKSRGVRVAMDVNHRALLMDAATAARTMAPLLASADLVVCASRDAASLFGAEGSALDRAHLLRRTVAVAADLVVVTDGERGAAAVSETGEWWADAVPTRMVDRFGAGDAFTAGLLWSLTSGASVDDALAAGTALAAMVCTVHGDSATFGVDELEAVLADAEGVMVR